MAQTDGFDFEAFALAAVESNRRIMEFTVDTFEGIYRRCEEYRNKWLKDHPAIRFLYKINWRLGKLFTPEKVQRDIWDFGWYLKGPLPRKGDFLDNSGELE